MRAAKIVLAAVFGIIGLVVGGFTYGWRDRGQQLPLALRVIEISSMRQSEVSDFEFTLVNHLSESIIIDVIESSCSCTNLDQESLGDKVGPGKTKKLKGSVHSGMAKGEIGSRLRVTASTASGRTFAALGQFKTTVVPDVVFEPEFLELGEIHRSELKEFSVDVTSETKDFRVEVVRDADLSVAVRSVDVLNSRHSRIWIVCSGDKIPMDQQSSYGSLAFKTDATGSHLFHLNCRVAVASVATVIPTVIVFTENQKKATIRMEMKPSSRPAGAIFDAKVSSSDLEVSPLRENADGSFEVTVELSSLLVADDFQGVVTVGSKPSGLFSFDVPVSYFKGDLR